MTIQEVQTYQVVDANNTPVETLINSVAANTVSLNNSKLGNVSLNSSGVLTAQTGLNFINSISSQISVTSGTGSNANIAINGIVKLMVPCSDLVTPLNQSPGYPGTLAYMRSPRPFTITGARASFFGQGSTGNTQIQITVNGSNVFSTLLQIDNTSTTSVGSLVTPILNSANLAVPDNGVLGFSSTNAANGVGLIVTLYGI
jgi:hypothetical protein